MIRLLYRCRVLWVLKLFILGSDQSRHSMPVLSLTYSFLIWTLKNHVYHRIVETIKQDYTYINKNLYILGLINVSFSLLIISGQIFLCGNRQRQPLPSPFG